MVLTIKAKVRERFVGYNWNGDEPDNRVRGILRARCTSISLWETFCKMCQFRILERRLVIPSTTSSLQSCSFIIASSSLYKMGYIIRLRIGSIAFLTNRLRRLALLPFKSSFASLLIHPPCTLPIRRFTIKPDCIVWTVAIRTWSAGQLLYVGRMSCFTGLLTSRAVQSRVSFHLAL